MENEILSILSHGQVAFGFEKYNPIQLSISQFYGIEINDFAVTVAKTALWIAESQMMKETEEIILMHLDLLPLKTNANIIEGNALRLDRESVVPIYELNYIMGNPPFVGERMMNAAQKEDVNAIFPDWKNVGNLDCVTCRYKKCADLMMDALIRSALVRRQPRPNTFDLGSVQTAARPSESACVAELMKMHQKLVCSTTYSHRAS